MVAEGNAKIGIEIEARDNTKRGFDSATKGATNLKAKFSGLSSGVKAMPEQFGKASTALLLFQSSTSQMGGKVADAANKLTGVAGLVATGGPFGVALAAATGLIAAASFAWEVYSTDVVEAERVTRGLNKSLGESGDRLARINTEMQRRNDVTLAQNAGSSLALQLERDIQIAEVRRIRAVFEMKELKFKAGIEGRALSNEESAQHASLMNQLALQISLREKAKELLSIERAEIKKNTDTAKTEGDKRLAAERRRNWASVKSRLDAIAAKEAAALAAEEREAIAIDRAHRLAIMKQRAAAIAMIEGVRSLNEAAAMERAAVDAAWLDKQKEEHAKALAVMSENSTVVAESFAAGMTTAFASIADGSKTAGEAFEDMATKMLLQAASAASHEIMIQAALAAAKAFQAHQTVPFVGLAIGTAAAGAAFAATSAYAQKFNFGGMVEGGRPGVDSVLGLLKPGEFVLPTETVNKIKGQPRGNSTTNNNNNAQSITLNVQSRPGQSFRSRDLRDMGRDLAEYQLGILSRGGVV